MDEARHHNLLDKDVKADLGQLDKVYMELKSEMLRKKDINNEELMRENDQQLQNQIVTIGNIVG